MIHSKGEPGNEKRRKTERKTHNTRRTERQGSESDGNNFLSGI